jgi:hypothetical protein
MCRYSADAFTGPPRLVFPFGEHRGPGYSVGLTCGGARPAAGGANLTRCWCSSPQGLDKSSALAVLAGNGEWFTDSLPLGADDKKVIETLKGRWIVEAAELQGLRKGDVEHLKAFLSRRIDRGRPAYGRLPIEAPRQCVIIGTTNSERYLRDSTGNRRFWPVRVARFDLDALRRDHDQIWAEAAAIEAKGESIRLDPRLYPDPPLRNRWFARPTAGGRWIRTLRLGRYDQGFKIPSCRSRQRKVGSNKQRHGRACDRRSPASSRPSDERRGPSPASAIIVSVWGPGRPICDAGAGRPAVSSGFAVGAQRISAHVAGCWGFGPEFLLGNGRQLVGRAD